MPPPPPEYLPTVRKVDNLVPQLMYLAVRGDTQIFAYNHTDMTMILIRRRDQSRRSFVWTPLVDKISQELEPVDFYPVPDLMNISFSLEI